MKLRDTLKRLIPRPAHDLLRHARSSVQCLLEDILRRVSPRAVHLPVCFSATGGLDACFLVGTSSGLLFYDSERHALHRIIDGYVYGITRSGSRWYAFRKHVTRYTQRAIGQVISFQLDGSEPKGIRVEVNSLDPSVHQIDAWGGHLFLADTANNRLIRYALTRNGLSQRTDFYPSGRLDSGEESDNYVHLNSLFSRNGETYLVYHNHSTKTGRNSQIATLSRTLNVRRIVNTPAGDAHNVFWDGRASMYCDSRAGTFICGETVFECGCFTRGLAVARNFVLVGGSDWADKDERDRTTGYVFAFDRKLHRELARLRLPGVGSVYEIRLIKPVDLAMSGQETRR